MMESKKSKEVITSIQLAPRMNPNPSSSTSRSNHPSNPSSSTSRSKRQLPRLDPIQEESSAPQAKDNTDQGQEQEQNQTRTRNRQTAHHQSNVNIIRVRNMPTDRDPIHSMHAPYNHILITGTAAGRVIQWNNGQRIRSLQSESHGGPASAVALHIDHETSFVVYVAHSKGLIRVWRYFQTTDNFVRIATLQRRSDYFKNKIFPCRKPHPSNMVRCLCVSDDHNFVYSGAADGTLNTWSINDLHKLVHTTRRHKGPLRALAVGPGVVFSGGDRGVIIMSKRKHRRLVDRVTHSVLGIFTAQNEVEPVHINSLQFGRLSSGGGWLYAGCSDGRVRCWKDFNLVNPKAHEHVPEVMIHDSGEQQTGAGEITCLALSSGLLVFSGATCGTICVWNRISVDEPHRLETVLQAHTSPVKCIAVQTAWNVIVNDNRPNKWALYSCSERYGSLTIWSVEERGVQDEATGSGELTGSGGARGSAVQVERGSGEVMGSGPSEGTMA